MKRIILESEAGPAWCVQGESLETFYGTFRGRWGKQVKVSIGLEGDNSRSDLEALLAVLGERYREGPGCGCEFTHRRDPASPGDIDDWHFQRVCGYCGAQWWSLYCPHDPVQAQCTYCGVITKPMEGVEDVPGKSQE